MPLPLLPIAVTVLVGVAYHQKTKHDKKTVGIGELTPQRQEMYENAMVSQSDPEKLRTLSKAFRAQGLPTHADMLEKRAKLREMPPALKAQRKVTFQKALQCQDANKVFAVANLYEREGCTGSAAALREHAAKLRAIEPDATVTPAIPIQQPPIPTVQPQVVQVAAHGDEEDIPPLTEDEEMPEPNPDDEEGDTSDEDSTAEES